MTTMGRLDLPDVYTDEHDVSTHALLVTVFCKRDGCEEEAEDRRGRYAGLCSGHKADQIADDREQLQRAAAKPRPKSELGAAAAVLQRQARRVDKASKKLEDERAELRSAYLQFGVVAGFLAPRGDR